MGTSELDPDCARIQTDLLQGKSVRDESAQSEAYINVFFSILSEISAWMADRGYERRSHSSQDDQGFEGETPECESVGKSA